MNPVIDKIRAILDEKDMSIRELGRLSGIPQTTINRYITTASLKIPIEKLKQIASALGVSPAYLMGWEERTPVSEKFTSVSVRKFPMLGSVSCGYPVFANEEHEVFVEASSDIRADFCLTAKGDSMVNARIFDGDILFVKKQQMVHNGEIAVVLIDDEATVKRVYYDYENNTITLMPENPIYKPMRYEGETLNRIRIIGRVVAGQYKFD